MKTFVSMNIAVIGYATAEITARKLAKAGHKVFIGNNEQTMLIKRMPKNVYHTTIEKAVQEADLIFIATPVAEVREVAYRMGDVRRRVIIDYTAIASEEVTQTASAIKAITGSQHVVKCFMPTGYEDIAIPGINEEPTDMFIASDSKKAKLVFGILATDMGYEHVYDMGNHASIAMLDEMNAYTIKKKKTETEPVLVKR